MFNTLTVKGLSAAKKWYSGVCACRQLKAVEGIAEESGEF